jgi:hypothetical protein
METFAFGVRRDWPSVTTCSPSRRPAATTESVPAVRSTVTGRCCAVPLSLITYTYGPVWPVTTACVGTTMAPCSTNSRSWVETNSPAQSRLLGLGNDAFSSTVPVVVSTALSMK